MNSSEFFDRLNEWIRDTENSIVNFLSAFAPWLAPLIPAYMTFQHAGNTLKFPFFFALSAAAFVEILGFSAVSTYLSFWFHNRKNAAESKKAPVGLVIIAFAFYLALIVASNVLLDTFAGQKWAEIAVRALFTFQTIPAAMLVSVRTQHRDLLREIAKEKAERKTKVSETSPDGNETSTKVSGNFPKDWRRLRPTLSMEQVHGISRLTPPEIQAISRQYNVDVRTVQNWREYARKELKLN